MKERIKVKFDGQVNEELMNEVKVNVCIKYKDLSRLYHCLHSLIEDSKDSTTIREICNLIDDLEDIMEISREEHLKYVRF